MASRILYCKNLLRSMIAAVAIAAAMPCQALEADSATVKAEPLMRVSAGLDVTVSGANDFSPYYIGSNSHGMQPQANSTSLFAGVDRAISTNRRFTYGFGAKAYVGWASSVNYERCNEEGEMTTNPQHPSRAWLQDLWVGVKFRGVYVKAGMWDNGERSLFGSDLGTGDIIMSSNARGVPRISAGFIDFQDIPFTQKWVQIRGEISYGKFVDTEWLDNHYNRLNSFVTTGAWMHFASCHFRTNPSKRFYATIGMQHAVQFGGKTIRYKNGELISVHETQVTAKDFFNALLPWKGGGSSDVEGDRAYYSGNHLGSWDLILNYRLTDGAEVRAYVQSPFEDGSGIGKKNGFDGVWGVGYTFGSGWKNDRFRIKEVVAEYIDFTNQSGPMHWAPGDFPGTGIGGAATGADDYYNNYMYNGWANYGMGLGSAFVKSPIYNIDGYMRYTDNRVRGFQVGVKGSAAAGVLDWRLLASYRTSWGTPFLPALKKRHSTSVGADVQYRLPAMKNFALGAMIAFDLGNLYEDNLGVAVSLKYDLDLKR